MRTIAIINREGFSSTITEDGKGVVRFKADADIDADGANGQRGGLAAYRSDDRGSEYLANGGMKRQGGEVVFAENWGADIVITRFGKPVVLPDGTIPSKTSYRFPGKDSNDPAAYVDSDTVPYVVVPPEIIAGVKPVVMGCQAYATYKGRRVGAVVADRGPRRKVGEVSIELARRLGIPHSPRNGGEDEPLVEYEILPGVPAVVDGVTYELLPS